MENILNYSKTTINGKSKKKLNGKEEYKKWD